jgi:hypothetical protein
LPCSSNLFFSNKKSCQICLTFGSFELALKG